MIRRLSRELILSTLSHFLFCSSHSPPSNFTRITFVRIRTHGTGYCSPFFVSLFLPASPTSGSSAVIYGGLFITMRHGSEGELGTFHLRRTLTLGPHKPQTTNLKPAQAHPINKINKNISQSILHCSQVVPLRSPPFHPIKVHTCTTTPSHFVISPPFASSLRISLELQLALTCGVN
jgi:hypothetical protein